MRAKRLAQVIVALVVMMGCAAGETTAQAATVHGVYSLRTVDGSKLPFAIPGELPVATVVSQILVINENGTFSIYALFQVDGQAQSPETESGTWRIAGKTITLTTEEPDIKGTWQGDTITMTITAERTFTLVFQK